MNLREAWAKRRYEAHFVSKLTDCDGENSETDSSLDFARDCFYINDQKHEELAALCQEVGKMLGVMIRHPDKFLTSDLWNCHEHQPVHNALRRPRAPDPPFAFAPHAECGV